MAANTEMCSGVPEWKRILIMKKRSGDSKSGSERRYDTTPPKTVTIGSINVALRCVQSPHEAPATVHPDFEDLCYGPGIVDRLRAKFLNLGTQPPAKPVVRRFSSLENLPGSHLYRVNAKTPRPNGLINGKAQSMETLVCPAMEHAQVFARRARTPNIDEIEEDEESTRNRLTVDQNELPKRDTVRLVKRIFESPLSNGHSSLSESNRVIGVSTSHRFGRLHESNLPPLLPDSKRIPSPSDSNPVLISPNSEKIVSSTDGIRSPSDSHTTRLVSPSNSNASPPATNNTNWFDSRRIGSPNGSGNVLVSPPGNIVSPSNIERPTSLNNTNSFDSRKIGSPTSSSNRLISASGNIVSPSNSNIVSPTALNNTNSCDSRKIESPIGSSNVLISASVNIVSPSDSRETLSPSDSNGAVSLSESQIVSPSDSNSIASPSGSNVDSNIASPSELNVFSNIACPSESRRTENQWAPNIESPTDLNIIVSPSDLKSIVSPSDSHPIDRKSAKGTSLSLKDPIQNGLSAREAISTAESRAIQLEKQVAPLLSPLGAPTECRATECRGMVPPRGTASVVFDFRGKDVTPSLARRPAPFGCRPASSDDVDDDFDDTDIGADLPAVSGVIFSGENIKVGRGALLEKRNKNLSIQFDDQATTTFEYPSEYASSPNSEEEPWKNSFGTTILVGSPENSRLGLSNYLPQVLSCNDDFKLGVSQPNYRPTSLSEDFKKINSPENTIIPADPDDVSGWSSSETSDILF